MPRFDGRRQPARRPAQPLPQTPPPMPPPAPVAPPPAPVAAPPPAATQRYIPPGLTTRSSSSKELDERKMRRGGRGSQPIPGSSMIPGEDFPTSMAPSTPSAPIPPGAVFNEPSRRGQRTEDNPGGYGRINPGTTTHIGQGLAPQSGGGYPTGPGNPFAQAAQRAGFTDFAPKVPIDRRPSTGGRVRAHQQKLADSLRSVFGGKRGKGGDNDG